MNMILEAWPLLTAIPRYPESCVAGTSLPLGRRSRMRRRGSRPRDSHAGGRSTLGTFSQRGFVPSVEHELPRGSVSVTRAPDFRAGDRPRGSRSHARAVGSFSPIRQTVGSFHRPPARGQIFWKAVTE